MRHVLGGPVLRAPILVLLLAGAACDGTVEDLGLPELVLGDVVHALPVTLEDSTLYGSGADLVPHGELLLVSESPRHRVTVLDTALHLRGRIGREGRGPGELRYPSDVEVTPGGLVAVVEGGNGRFSVFSIDGQVAAIYRPMGQRAIAALSDTSFVVTSSTEGHALERLTSNTLSPFGPPDTNDEDRRSDFQYLLPARLEDGTPLVAHLRSSDLSFRLLDHSGHLIRDVPPPTQRSEEDLLRANAHEVERTSRALGDARVLDSSAITVGQTSSDGRWIPVFYHEVADRPYLYDVWRDRWYRLRHSDVAKALPARASVVIGNALYVYEQQAGIFAYELDLPH